MKLSINPLIKGKIDKTLVSQIEKLNAWTEVEAKAEELFELITVDGYATTCLLHGGNRKEFNYCSRQLFMIDIDGGMTIEQLLEDEFYNRYAAGFYATSSFTPEHHKFRILFITPEPIVAASVSRKIIRGLRKLYPESDAACVDPARLFYGSINCEIKEWQGNELPQDIVNSLIEIIDEEDRLRQEELDRRPPVEYPMTDERKAKIIKLLHSCFIGERTQWRNIGWGMKKGGFTLEDFQYVTTGMMRLKTAKDAANIWRDGRPDGTITMGTVIQFLKDRLGPDCLKITEEDRLEQMSKDILKKYKEVK